MKQASWGFKKAHLVVFGDFKAFSERLWGRIGLQTK
jgi:hypothetical protein